MDWGPYYPAFVESANGTAVSEEYPSAISERAFGRLSQDVEVADIGCGFGGLLVALAPKLPNTLLLGIADKTPSFAVTNFYN